MTRTMYDAVTVGNIPQSATMVAGYVDGNYKTVPALRRRFPKAKIVTITVLGGDLTANVVDIETGDCTPASGVAWAKRRLAAGYHPTLYMNASTWPAVKAEVHRQGLDGKVSYWVAQYDNHPVIPAGAVAKQYIDHGPHGENVDISVVADYWPGVDPKPTPKPAAPTYVYRRTLRIGMVGSDVTQLKVRLRYLGYSSIPGPIFGRGLDASVRAFQKNHRLAVDGVVGPITARAIG